MRQARVEGLTVGTVPDGVVVGVALAVADPSCVACLVCSVCRVFSFACSTTTWSSKDFIRAWFAVVGALVLKTGTETFSAGLLSCCKSSSTISPLCASATGAEINATRSTSPMRNPSFFTYPLYKRLLFVETAVRIMGLFSRRNYFILHVARHRCIVRKLDVGNPAAFGRAAKLRGKTKEFGERHF